MKIAKIWTSRKFPTIRYHVLVGRLVLTFNPLSKISCHTMYCLPSEATRSSRLGGGGEGEGGREGGGRGGNGGRNAFDYWEEILTVSVIAHLLRVVELCPTFVTLFYHSYDYVNHLASFPGHCHLQYLVSVCKYGGEMSGKCWHTASDWSQGRSRNKASSVVQNTIVHLIPKLMGKSKNETVSLFYIRCFIVLLQFAVVGVIVILHPLLDLWVALPAGGGGGGERLCLHSCL